MRAGIKKTMRRFADDRRGNFALLMGLLLVPLMLGVGYYVNFSQMVQVKSSLRGAVDAALTSTARNITQGVIPASDAQAAVEKYLKVNTDGKFATSHEFVLDELIVNTSEKTLSAKAHAVVDLAFPFWQDPRVNIEAAAIYSEKRVEIAMMLDITGSMKYASGSSTRIEALKNAAKNAVNTALDKNGSASNPRIRVAIIPYSNAVNVGASLFQSSVYVETPGGSNFANGPSTATALDNCATERKLQSGGADYSDAGPFPVRVNRDDRLDLMRNNFYVGSSLYGGEEPCPTAVMVPLTADRTRLLDAINGLQAKGSTAGGIGIQWTYYMLSPSWSSAIRSAGGGDGPANYDSTGRRTHKVAILMTDGMFNTSFIEGVQYPAMGAPVESMANARALCSSMKSNDIEVYTIGFALSESDDSAQTGQAQATLQSCASPDTGATRHYFDVTTGAELDAAFQEIVANTERLALSR